MVPVLLLDGERPIAYYSSANYRNDNWPLADLRGNRARMDPALPAKVTNTQANQKTMRRRRAPLGAGKTTGGLTCGHRAGAATR